MEESSLERMSFVFLHPPEVYPLQNSISFMWRIALNWNMAW